MRVRLCAALHGLQPRCSRVRLAVRPPWWPRGALWPLLRRVLACLAAGRWRCLCDHAACASAAAGLCVHTPASPAVAASRLLVRAVHGVCHSAMCAHNAWFVVRRVASPARAVTAAWERHHRPGASTRRALVPAPPQPAEGEGCVREARCSYDSCVSCVVSLALWRAIVSRCCCGGRWHVRVLHSTTHEASVGPPSHLLRARWARPLWAMGVRLVAPGFRDSGAMPVGSLEDYFIPHR